MYNVRYCRQFVEKLSFIKLLFQLHINTKSKERLELFKRFGFYNVSLVKVVLVLYTGAVASFIPYPLYMYYFKNQLVPFILLSVPGIDENTVSGYVILMIIQASLLVLAVVGLAVCDILVAIITINIPIFSRLIEDETNKLNETLEEGREDVRVMKAELRNLLMMHQEMAK